MPTFMEKIFGSKPTVPDLKAIDFGQQQRIAIRENQDALPGIENLAGSVNAFNEAEMARSMGISLSEYKSMKAGTTGSIKDLLKGKIPADVLDNIQRQGSERGLFLGVGGAPASRSWTAADIGRTSLNMFSSGLDAASRWMATNKANSFDITSMFITPQQQLMQATNERDQAWNVSWLKNQVSAMPDPVAHAVWQVIHEIGMKALGMAMGGGGMGGGGGGVGGGSAVGAYSFAPQGGPTSAPVNFDPGSTG